MTLDVSLALVLAVEGLAADAAGEAPHAGVYRAVTQQRALGREALAALMTDERAVGGQRVREVPRQVDGHFAAVAARELAAAARRRRSHVLGDLLGTERVLGGTSTPLASLHVQSVHHEVSFDAAAALHVQRRRVVVHYNVFHLRPATQNTQCKSTELNRAHFTCVHV